jgi:hypothetical protein
MISTVSRNIAMTAWTVIRIDFVRCIIAAAAGSAHRSQGLILSSYTSDSRSWRKRLFISTANPDLDSAADVRNALRLGARLRALAAGAPRVALFALPDQSLGAPRAQ